MYSAVRVRLIRGPAQDQAPRGGGTPPRAITGSLRATPSGGIPVPPGAAPAGAERKPEPLLGDCVPDRRYACLVLGSASSGTGVAAHLGCQATMDAPHGRRRGQTIRAARGAHEVSDSDDNARVGLGPHRAMVRGRDRETHHSRHASTTGGAVPTGPRAGRRRGARRGCRSSG